MNTKTVNIKIEPTLKKQAQKTADELGLTLSAVMKVLLKQFVRTKQLSVGVTEIPNKQFMQSIQQSEKDIKAGRVTLFTTWDDALSYLDAEIADERRNTKQIH